MCAAYEEAWKARGPGVLAMAVSSYEVIAPRVRDRECLLEDLKLYQAALVGQKHASPAMVGRWSGIVENLGRQLAADLVRLGGLDRGW